MWIKSQGPTDLDKATESGVEGAAVEGADEEIRGRGGAPPRLEDSEVAANDINAVLQRVAGFSIAEIDRQISELRMLREKLQSEGARVQREITEYAQLSQRAMQSTKIITGSLAKPKFEGV